MSEYAVTPRTKLKRAPKRGVYDKAQVHAMIDEAYFCHVATIGKNGPIVQPTTHWRQEEEIFIHGSNRNGLFQSLIAGEECCITVTHLDGLVMARSAMHHSANYRSVMVYGKVRVVDDEDEKMDSLKWLVEKIAPGRWDEVRGPNKKEMKATMVLALKLEEVSAKVRTGNPIDDEEDYDIPVWAGVVPMEVVKHDPIDDDRLINGVTCNLR
ncbi:MAG: pyridoxamine 5'-phosphate oxidase family protein [Rhodospirillales bacterium]|nr:pyridoxamine 5'-phosphate oxidase family protein [Rhodospirillales bacterium]